MKVLKRMQLQAVFDAIVRNCQGQFLSRFASIKVWHRTYYKWVHHIFIYADGNEQDDIGEIEYSHFCSGSLNLID